MGIEPTQSAWKAGALPLSYTRITPPKNPRRVLRSLGFIHLLMSSMTNRCQPSMRQRHPLQQRIGAYGGGGRIRTYVRVRGQIYSLLPLTTRPPLPILAKTLPGREKNDASIDNAWALSITWPANAQGI